MTLSLRTKVLAGGQVMGSHAQFRNEAFRPCCTQQALNAQDVESWMFDTIIMSVQKAASMGMAE